MTELTQSPRRRAASIDFECSRKAREAVEPLNAQIGPLQEQAVRLIALGMKLRQTGRSEPRLASEAEVLLRQVEVHRQVLADRMSSLPREVTSHSRFVDAQRALQSLAAGARQAADLLGRAPGTGGYGPEPTTGST